MPQVTSPRTSLSDLRESYHHIFSSGLAFSKIKDEALTDRLFPKDGPTTDEAPGVSGRSIAWKLFLAKHEPLQASTPPRVTSLLQDLQKSREKWVGLFAEKTRPPDERLADAPSARSPDAARNINLNNPLSQHNENPWNGWFEGLEVKKTISQDVERTFPDMPFFRGIDVQEQLTNILFVWASTHPHIGYRQGMHELLAPLYYAIHFDSVTDDAPVEPELREICAMKHVAGDAWALFDTVMDGVSTWYEWREPDPRSPMDQGKGSMPGHVHLVAPTGPNGLQPWVAPIVKACNRIQNDHLKIVDPALWSTLNKANIEPQMYGIRWLRMLFTREFPMAQAMALWDALFACDPSLELAQWVCVAMLIRVRGYLLGADYSSQLTTLLRYPAPPKQYQDGAPCHTSMLLQQALVLQMSPTISTAATLTMENRSNLGIPVEPADNISSSPPKRSILPRHRSGIAPSSRSMSGLRESGHSRQSSSPQLGLSEILSKGLLERGESLGINKTVLSAVAELKRNIPDISSFIKSPVVEGFPLADERPLPERPPWEPRSRLEVEDEMVTLRKRDKRLGDSLGWIVDVLLQDEETAEDAQRLRRQRSEALESLSYIRDVLISDAQVLEEERLVSEEVATAQRAKRRSLEPTSRPAIPSPLPATVVQSGSSDRKLIRTPPASFTPNRSIVNSSEGTDIHLAQTAPWNQSRSSFGRPAGGIGSTVLPRKPPPTSSTRHVDTKPGVVHGDPLGVFSK